MSTDQRNATMLAATSSAWDRLFMLMLIATLFLTTAVQQDDARAAAQAADAAASDAAKAYLEAAGASGPAEWDRAPTVTLPTTGSARLDTLPSGSSPCARIRRVMTDLPAWSARSAAAESAQMRIAAINDVSTTMEDLAADELGKSLAASLRQTSDLMSRDMERRDELREELETLTVELMLASLTVCRGD